MLAATPARPAGSAQGASGPQRGVRADSEKELTRDAGSDISRPHLSFEYPKSRRVVFPLNPGRADVCEQTYPPAQRSSRRAAYLLLRLQQSEAGFERLITLERNDA